MSERTFNRIVKRRGRAATKQRFPEFCRSSLELGAWYMAGADPSEALRPLGSAYLVACAVGHPLDRERAAAAKGLHDLYALTGNHALAAECGFEAVRFGGKQLGLVDVLVHLA